MAAAASVAYQRRVAWHQRNISAASSRVRHQNGVNKHQAHQRHGGSNDSGIKASKQHGACALSGISKHLISGA